MTWTCLSDKLSRGSAEISIFSRGEGCWSAGLTIIIHHHQLGLRSIFVWHLCIYSLWIKSYFNLFCGRCVLNFGWWKSYIGHCLNIADPENRDTNRTRSSLLSKQRWASFLPFWIFSLNTSVCWSGNTPVLEFQLPVLIQFSPMLFLESHWPFRHILYTIRRCSHSRNTSNDVEETCSYMKVGICVDRKRETWYFASEGNKVQ